MGISLIAAVGKNKEIGLDNKLLWHIKEDFQWFKEKTVNKPVVMGRNTWISIGKPLPQRENIILTRRSIYRPSGITVLSSIADVLAYTRNEKEVMIIGGASVYTQFLPYADRLYLTEIDKEFTADSFFPYFNRDDYIECFSLDGTEDVGFKYRFKTYKKKLK